MKHTLTLAAAQTVPAPGDVDANTRQHERFVRVAAAEGVDLLLFPELSLTGYELHMASDLAFSGHDERLRPICSLAEGHGMTLVVGAPVRMAGRLHIGAFIVSPDGGIDLYTKHHIGQGEETFVEPGSDDALVQIGGMRAAIAICADAKHQAHAQAAAGGGAEVYLASAFVTPAELPSKIDLLGGHARRCGMTVLLANYGGPSGGSPSGGSSAIWSDTGRALATAEPSGSGLVIGRKSAEGWRGRISMLEG